MNTAGGTSRVRRRRRGTGTSTGLSLAASSRRLSSVVNPDLLNDVCWHTAHQFSQQAPTRRHSIANVLPSFARIAPPPPQKSRAVSERLVVSKSDVRSLLEEWKDNERKEGKQVRLEEAIKEVDEDEEDWLLDDEEVNDDMTPPTSSWSIKSLVCGVFFGYVFSSLGLQKLNSLRPGCGQLVTLLQYIATIGEKCPRAPKYIHSPILPMKWHAIFVILMFLSVQMANASLGAGLPFSLFLIIKNTNLIFSLVIGWISGQSFTIPQILSIGVITAGILICVLSQNQSEGSSISNVTTETTEDKDGPMILSEDDADGNKITMMFPAALATASTFCMALLGTIQEYVFAQYKADNHQEAGESLFFTHLLGLPLFCAGDGFSSIRGDTAFLLRTPIVTAAMLLLNISATLVVKHSFVGLLEEGKSLTATLALTLARMSGVVVSQLFAVVFGRDGESDLRLNFWVGAIVVACGSLSYATNGKVLCVCRRGQHIK